MSIVSKLKRVLNALVRRSYWYNNIEFADCAKFWKHNTFGMDVINLGSSSALAAFDYSFIPQLRAANWAMSPQTLLADYEILRNYSCYLRAGTTVFIPLCPFSSLGGSNDYLHDKYYTILDIASIPHASYIRKQQLMSIKQEPLQYYPMMQLLTRHPRKKQDNTSGNVSENDAIIRMDSWRKEFSIIRFSDPVSLLNADAYNDSSKILRNIIDYCYERGFNPIIVIPPVSEPMRKQFTREMKSYYIDDFIKKSCGDDVYVLDYFAGKEFSNEFFRNSFLLNEKGARKFTKMILKQIDLVE